MERRRSVALSAVAVITVAVVVSASYFAGYLLLSDRLSSQGTRMRCFYTPWLATIYTPAAKLETLLTGIETEACDCPRY